MAEQSAPTTLSVSTFVEVIKRSQLINAEKLPRIIKSIAASTGEERTAEMVAEHLITSGLITKWQAAQLLKGKYRGFLIGKYSFRRPLGRGGMGVVFEAEHLVLGTLVAIKLLPKDGNATEKAVSRFLAEARAAAKLNHPNILRVHDCDVFEGRRFMVMDLIDGSNLGELVDRNGPLSYRNTIELLRQAASGLAFAHENGVIHRDVKPHNFMVDKNGQLKVADLGLALFQIDSPDRHTQDGNVAILGTVDYVAPEQAWDSRKVDRRADMYSLGCTLYFMLTGKAPFDSGTLAQRLAKHQSAQPTPITNYRPDCPAPIVNLCAKMMAKKPGDRVQNMADLESFCNKLLNKLPGSHGDLAGIASRTHSMRGSGSDAFLNISGMGHNSGETSFETMYGSDTDRPTASDFGASQGGDLSFLADALPPQQPAANAASQGGYWQQAAQAKPASTPAQRKASAKALVQERKNQIMLAVGLLIASISIGLTAWRVITPEPLPEPMKIRTYEDGRGNIIIIPPENK